VWRVGLGAVGQNKMCCKLCRLVRLFAALFILRSVGIFVCRFTVCFNVVVSSNRVAPNVLALGAVADFGAQNCQYTTKVDAR